MYSNYSHATESGTKQQDDLPEGSGMDRTAVRVVVTMNPFSLILYYYYYYYHYNYYL